MADYPEFGFIDSDGIWAEIVTPPAGVGERPALFLDRDGVVVEEAGYLHRAGEVSLIPGAADIIAEANRANVPVVIVTNQAGIGLRYYDWPQFAEVQDAIRRQLDLAGVRLSAIFACPFHADAHPPYRHNDHPCRKPNAGMLIKATRALSIDLPRSWLIGDRAIDVGAARNAGCEGAMHVRSGHGTRDAERQGSLALASKDFRVLTGETIRDALHGLPLIAGARAP